MSGGGCVRIFLPSLHPRSLAAALWGPCVWGASGVCPGKLPGVAPQTRGDTGQ